MERGARVARQCLRSVLHRLPTQCSSPADPAPPAPSLVQELGKLFKKDAKAVGDALEAMCEGGAGLWRRGGA